MSTSYRRRSTDARSTAAACVHADDKKHKMDAQSATEGESSSFTASHCAGWVRGHKQEGKKVLYRFTIEAGYGGTTAYLALGAGAPDPTCHEARGAEAGGTEVLQALCSTTLCLTTLLPRLCCVLACAAVGL
eukprot:scaffold106238_cov21-Tisochrysis_lutea.AAC.1